MKNKAFTLIELLVVIAIISVLIALLMPSLSRVTAGARRVGCASNMRSIGQALALYARDHNNRIPPYGPNQPRTPDIPGCWGYNPGESGTRFYYDQLGRHNPDRYLPSAHMYDWPEHDRHRRLGTVWKCTVPPCSVAGARELGISVGSPRSDYGLNRKVAPIDGRGIPWGYSTSAPSHHSGTFARVPSESTTGMLSDIRGILYARRFGGFGHSSGSVGIDTRHLNFRHQDGANVLFLDQHLEWVSGDFVIESIDRRNEGIAEFDHFWGQWW